MVNLIDISRSIKSPEYPFEFSICTLVTRKEEYGEMLGSFLDKGFKTEICEFLYIDNSDGCLYDAYQGLNYFLRQSKGKYIIICHQDILIHENDFNDLKSCLSQLDRLDQHWGVCGNAGAAGPNHIVYHITYPNLPLHSKGKFPLAVNTLDENFLIVKNEASLSVSSDLTGFHLYGTDLCLQANVKGYTAYVIAFNLTHKSRGNPNKDFYLIRKSLIKKYNHFFRTRWLQTNITVFHLSGSFIGRLLGNPLSLFFLRMYNSIKKKIG